MGLSSCNIGNTGLYPYGSYNTICGYDTLEIGSFNDVNPCESISLVIRSVEGFIVYGSNNNNNPSGDYYFGSSTWSISYGFNSRILSYGDQQIASKDDSTGINGVSGYYTPGNKETQNTYEVFCGNFASPICLTKNLVTKVTIYEFYPFRNNITGDIINYIDEVNSRELTFSSGTWTFIDGKNEWTINSPTPIGDWTGTGGTVTSSYGICNNVK